MKWRLDEPFAPRNLYCDFGITEAIVGALAFGAADAAVGAAITLPEIVVGADAAAAGIGAGAAGAFGAADAAAGLGALAAGTGVATAADAFGGGAADLSGGVATSFDAFGNPTGTPVAGGAQGIATADQGFGVNAAGQALDAFGNPVAAAAAPGTLPVTPTTGSLPVADATGEVAGQQATGAIEAGQSSAAFGAGDVGFVGGEPGGALFSPTTTAGTAPGSLGPSTFSTAATETPIIPQTPAVSGTVPGAGVASPTEAISGATGPLQAISDPTGGGSIWANTPEEIAAQGPVPSWQLGINAPPADNLQSFAATTNPGAADPFAAINSAAGPPGGVPDSLANVTSSGVLNDTSAALDQPATSFAPTQTATPGTGITSADLNPAATPGADTTLSGAAAASPPSTAIDPTAVAALNDPNTFVGAPVSAAGAPDTSVPAAASTTAAAKSPWDSITGALNSPTARALGTVAPLAMLGTTLIRGQPSLPSTAQQAIATSAPAAALGATDTAQAATGQPTASQLAQIDQWVQAQKNQLYQFYASQGRNPTNDTDYIQGVGAIDAQALGMRQQFVDSLATTGLNAISVANQPLLSAAQLQIQQDQAFQQSIAAALQSFGLVTALNAATASKVPTQTTATT